MADNTHANGAGVGYDPATTLIDLREADGRTQDEVFRTVGKQVEGLRLNRDDEDEEPKLLEEIESLCMNCEENGTTRLLLTKIPFFREVILMSFSCDACGFANTEIQSAGQIQEKGSKITFKLDALEDMERQIVKSDTAVFSIEDLDLQAPVGRGRLTNIEGMLSNILKDLEAGQAQRKTIEPELYEKITAVVQPLEKVLSGTNFPFTISIDDIAGNSMIERVPKDPADKYSRSDYARSSEQNAALGLGDGQTEADNGAAKAQQIPQIQSDEDGAFDDVDILDGVTYNLPTTCPGCSKPAQMNLQMVKVPYFKDVIISAVVCTECDYRTSDVKVGGEISVKGQRISLTVNEPIDLHRDILKSETCKLQVPECEVEVAPFTQGGRFTTVEGLLTHIRDQLHSSVFELDDDENKGGDSMESNKKQAWDTFFAKMDQAITGDIPFTILMEDPLANSYVQNLHTPDADPKIKIEEYKRTVEEEEELGLADMRTKMASNGEYVREEPTGSSGNGGPNAQETQYLATAAKAKDKETEKASSQQGPSEVQQKEGVLIDLS